MFLTAESSFATKSGYKLLWPESVDLGEEKAGSETDELNSSLIGEFSVHGFLGSPLRPQALRKSGITVLLTLRGLQPTCLTYRHAHLLQGLCALAGGLSGREAWPGCSHNREPGASHLEVPV